MTKAESLKIVTLDMLRDPHMTFARIPVLEAEHPEGPREIVLKYDDGIAVPVSYHDDLEAIDVIGGELLGPGLDIDGNGIALIPLAAVLQLYTCEEAEAIERMIDADERLLSYAN